MRNGARMLLAGVLGGAVALAPAGCGAASVPRADVEQQLVSKLEAKQVAVDGDAVTCPGDLGEEVGRSMRCRYAVDSQPVDLVVTVTSVRGGTVAFDYATEAVPVARALLETKVEAWARTHSSVPIDGVRCAADLQPAVGQDVTCDVTSGAQAQTVRAVVRSVEGGLVGVEITPG